MKTILISCSLVALMASSAKADPFESIFPPDPRPGIVNNFILSLDGGKAGFLKSAEGGQAKGQVVSETQGPDRVTRKHLSNVRYEPIAVQFGLGIGAPVFDWVSSVLNGNPLRKGGSVTSCDPRGEAKSELEFNDSLITEIVFPAFDSAAKEAGFFGLKVAPELTRTKKGSGKCATSGEKQKPWLTANFRLELEGVDTSRVMKIDSFTVKQPTAEEAPGDGRDRRSEPGKLEIPNLKITLSETGSESWQSWYESFVIRGENGQDKEKKGAIVFLTPDLKNELGRISLSNVGIFNLRPDKLEANSEQVRRLTAELYVERLELKIGN